MPGFFVSLACGAPVGGWPAYDKTRRHIRSSHVTPSARETNRNSLSQPVQNFGKFYLGQRSPRAAHKCHCTRAPRHHLPNAGRMQLGRAGAIRSCTHADVVCACNKISIVASHQSVAMGAGRQGVQATTADSSSSVQRKEDLQQSAIQRGIHHGPERFLLWPFALCRGPSPSWPGGRAKISELQDAAGQRPIWLLVLP
jgi:hypothetical protein